MLAIGIWPWIAFNLGVLVLLALDLGVFNRKAHVISLKEATIWSAVWIALSLAFNAGLYFLLGPEPALEFFTGYLIEKSLSIDNIFVFVLVFTYFNVEASYQHRVLFWGVLGALVMRGILIAVGATLLEQFHWIIYLFGAFLIFTGVRMAFQRETEVHPEKNPILKLVRRVIPVTENYERDHFFVRRAGKLLATPLLLVLIVVETTDLLFAVDSIPAIFAVTQDPFIVYTSNVCAILGLRSLYFVLANVVHKIYYLKLGLAVILAFVGVKMVLVDIFHIPTFLSLLVIALILAAAVVASLIRDRRLKNVEEAQQSVVEQSHTDV
ncbi:TerC family protein [Ktedonosporobacter rubrisoli]|uniref:TerC family protein n=1 Tax=Ktedonosporobacter rubrisoli TaxID=2509675 RepID=A0A4P6JSL8_KTERU|nr:TerC family protein [Ktedonosporobacter rubrisoli]QBD77866.1 TerC family protein [Ktedonosporobacter rubrisoli]